MPNATERCTACGDTAAIVRILERDGDTALCTDGDGQRFSIELDFVPQARAGDEVLAHFDVAIARIPETA